MRLRAAAAAAGDLAMGQQQRVDHTLTDQSSIIKFVEDNWGLPRIAGSFDAVAGSLNGLFDFAKKGKGPTQTRPTRLRSSSTLQPASRLGDQLPGRSAWSGRHHPISVQRRKRSANATEPGDGRVRMAILADASAASLHRFVADNVEPGATVVTDAWQGYRGLEGLGYTHDRHSQRAARARGDDPGELLPGQLIALIVAERGSNRFVAGLGARKMWLRLRGAGPRRGPLHGGAADGPSWGITGGDPQPSGGRARRSPGPGRGPPAGPGRP